MLVNVTKSCFFLPQTASGKWQFVFFCTALCVIAWLFFLCIYSFLLYLFQRFVPLFIQLFVGFFRQRELFLALRIQSHIAASFIYLSFIVFVQWFFNWFFESFNLFFSLHDRGLGFASLLFSLSHISASCSVCGHCQIDPRCWDLAAFILRYLFVSNESTDSNNKPDQRPSYIKYLILTQGAVSHAATHVV